MTVYYVTADSPGGRTGLSVAQSFTLGEAETTATAADEVRICQGNYLPTAAWTWDNTTNVGVNISPIYIRGYSADGTTPELVAIDGTNLPASTDIVLCTGSTANYLVFENLNFKNSKRCGIYMNGAWYATFIDCIFEANASHGINYVNSSAYCRAIRCWFKSNTGSGFYNNASDARGRLFATDTVFSGNGGFGSCDSGQAGIYNRPTYVNCQFIRNTSGGLSIVSTSANADLGVRGCTFFANGSHGLAVPANLSKISVVNTIFRSNGGYGIYTNTGYPYKFVDIRNLCSHNNTSGHIDINSGVLPGTGHVLEDPQFAVETSGSEDLTPANTNLKKSFAFPRGGTTHFWIGAIQPQPAAGGFPGIRVAR